jgi:hypothetical protein
MSDVNEMVVVDIRDGDRRRLWDAMTKRSWELYDKDYAHLDLGFDLPIGWPAHDEKIAFSQLVVLAKKLNMRIHIRELEMTPL